MPQYTNAVYPTQPEQIAAMQEDGPEGPIYMVNLLKFKERAEYADGRETNLTGREAYGLYGQAVAGIIQDFEGEVFFAADVTFLSLGEVDELWDEIAIARYPSRRHMVAMSMSEAWLEASVHREAGLAGQLNIETTMMPGFAAMQQARPGATEASDR